MIKPARMQQACPLNEATGFFPWKKALAGVALTAVLSPMALAQPRPAAPRPAGAAPAGSTGAKPPKATPVDSTEDKLLGALAGREMETLLNYYFEKNKIPPEKQKAIRGLQAMKQIGDPKLTPGRRRVLLNDAVKGVKTFVASTSNTETLMNTAGVIIEYGTKGQINQIEYFGESPARQSELNDASEAVALLLDKTIEECELQQNQALAGKTRPNAQDLAKWQTLDDRLNGAHWTKAFAAYGLALGKDAADPKRKEVAEAAIKYLSDFEKAEFKREGPVKIQLGKLLMVSGQADAAVAKFGEASKVAGLEKLQQYEIRFYTTLANLMGKKDKAAEASLAELKSWVAANLKPEEAKEVSAGVGLLEYRIFDLKESLTKDPKQQRDLHDKGEAVLTQIIKENPKLEPVIKKLLLEKLPENADLTKLDTILLRALMAKGVDEYIRAKDGLADDKGKPVLAKSIKAGLEIEKRKGQPNVSDDVADEAAFLVGMFYSKMGNATEAVQQSLHYLKEHGKNPERVGLAVQNALSGVDELRKDPAAMTSGAVGALIDQTWAAAIKHGRKEYSFVYGKRLFDQAKKPADYLAAANVLKGVADTHPAVTHARFFQLSAMQNVLDDKSLDAASRQKLVGDIEKLAADVNTRIDKALETATEEQKPRLRFYKVSATLLAADLAQKEMKDNAKVLTLLTGFDDAVKGLPKETDLRGTSLRLRINAYMALGKTNDAVDEVQKLIAQGGNAANILYTLIQQMDDSYKDAAKRKDMVAMQQNSASQVALIEPLIKQAKDPAAKDAYEAWEAKLLLRAAAVESDQTKRTAYLTKAQSVFDRQLSKATEGTPAFDNLRYQLALISYELKDYKKVQQELGQLIANGKLGPPDIRDKSVVDGSEAYKDNPVYWEGLLRFMQANFELSKTDASPEMAAALKNNREALQTLYINRGKNVGGANLQEEFAQLKAQLLPGWDETKISTTQPATKPAGK